MFSTFEQRGDLSTPRAIFPHGGFLALFIIAPGPADSDQNRLTDFLGAGCQEARDASAEA